MSEFSAEIFLPVSRIIVAGAIAYSALKTIQGSERVEYFTLSCIISLLGIAFYQSYFSTLESISSSFELFIQSAGKGESVFKVLARMWAHADSTHSMPDFSDPQGGNSIASALKFAATIKTGVWGVITMVIEFLFIILSEVLVALSTTLLKVVELLFPLGAALFAARPEILKNLALYSVELSLWVPCLSLIRGIVGIVSKKFLEAESGFGDSDLGLKMIAVQLSAIILFASIPKFVHSVCSGSISGDMGLTPSKVMSPVVQPIMAKANFLRGKYFGTSSKSVLVFLLLSFANSAQSDSASVIKLYPGFITKIECKGRLLLSAVGDETLVQKAGLPNEMGCGLLLKPLKESSYTNLILETSTGTIRRSVEITKAGPKQPFNESQILMEGDQK